jgi:hypothetical protein
MVVVLWEFRKKDCLVCGPQPVYENVGHNVHGHNAEQKDFEVALAENHSEDQKGYEEVHETHFLC